MLSSLEPNFDRTALSTNPTTQSQMSGHKSMEGHDGMSTALCGRIIVIKLVNMGARCRMVGFSLFFAAIELFVVYCTLLVFLHRWMRPRPAEYNCLLLDWARPALHSHLAQSCQWIFNPIYSMLGFLACTFFTGDLCAIRIAFVFILFLVSLNASFTRNRTAPHTSEEVATVIKLVTPRRAVS